MKTNIILGGVLILLLSLAYFFIEQPQHEGHSHAKYKQVINKDKIDFLEFNRIPASYREGQWFAGDSLLSHNSMVKLLQLLSEVSLISEIKEQSSEESYFNTRLEFKVNQDIWVLGDYNLDQTAFYLKVNEKLYQATFEGEHDEIFAHNENPLRKKMAQLQTLLSQGLVAWQENQAFRYYPKLPVGKVIIESDGRPSYTLDLVENKTSPESMKGVEVLPDLFNKFYTHLTQLTIKNFATYPMDSRAQLLGSITFSKEKETIRWKFYLKRSDSADVYLVDDENKKAFEIVGGTLRFLFLQVQDYWDKKIIPPSEFKSFSKLNISISQGSKEALVVMRNSNPLEFDAEGFQVQEEQMNQLINVIFNLSHFDQADRLSPLSETDRKLLLNANPLRISVLAQELYVWPKPGELIVVNLTQGFKVHFFKSPESFPTNFEDVLK